MFGKKCPKCGKKLSKQKVWHAKTGTFEFETSCILCPSSEDNPITVQDQNDTATIRHKTAEELEKEQSERESIQIEEKRIYEEFIKKEKERMDEEKKSEELVVNLIKNGNLLYIEGKLEEAMDSYDKALGIDPDNTRALKGKGDVLSKEEKYEEAMQFFNRILAINQNNIGALTAKADLLSKRGNQKLAIRYFDRILEMEPNNVTALEGKEALKQVVTDNQIFEDKSKKLQELESDPLVVEKSSKPTKTEGGLYGNCATPDCKTKLHDLNSKHCKLCNQRVCIDHLQLHINKFCPKTMYVKYIRKLWLMKRGQNVSSGMYSIVCETCGYVSEFPQLIEYAGQELESHLNNNPECKANKKTFLEEFDLEPIPKGVRVESSIVRDPTRTLWVCAHCRPPRKFTNHDEYIAHHYTHS